MVWKVALAFISTGIDRGGHTTYFLRAYAGAPVAQTLRPSSLRCGERLCDTLRALPENVAAPYAYRVQQRDGVLHAPTGAPVLASLRTP